MAVDYEINKAIMGKSFNETTTNETDYSGQQGVLHASDFFADFNDQNASSSIGPQAIHPAAIIAVTHVIQMNMTFYFLKHFTNFCISNWR